MSSKVTKASRKAKCPKPLEPIITRTKSAQQRQLNKKQKTEKLAKPEKPKITKIETKSPKSKKKSIDSKDTPLKKPEKKVEEIIEQVEYYPNTLKRDLSNKKVILKPKHNFKVIATTNKRKLAVPKKGIKPDLKSAPKSELSMQDMVRMMEETRPLSDEDFMEILTCPSPVWWEDPPDQNYYEDSVYTRSPEPQRIKTPENKVITISPEPPPKKKTKQINKKKRKGTKSNKTPEFITQDKPNEEKTIIKKDAKFVKKQLKLENILGNIKNKSQTQNKKEEIKENVKKRKLSESTEGDISDLSFNEDILKNIETMVIPMEKANEQEIIEIQDDNQKEIKKGLLDERPHIKKPEIKDVLPMKSRNIDKKKINNDDVISVDSFDNTSLSLIDDSNSSEDLSIEEDNIKRLTDEIESKISKNCKSGIPYKKIITDLTEYITVYKIIPEKAKAELNAKTTENNNKNKLDTVRGKLNDFFKHCKSNKRLKKSDSSTPANPVTDVKNDTTDEKENGKTELEEKSLVKCDQCVEKTVNGKTVLSCEKCELGPILPCDLCNFRAETKELYKKHVSTCKEVERISWSNNLLLNQT